MADGPKLTALGKLVILLFILALLWRSLLHARATRYSPTRSRKDRRCYRSGSPGGFLGGGTIAPRSASPMAPRSGAGWSGQSKNSAKPRDGKNIKINLIPMGSIEGAHALLVGRSDASTSGRPQAPPTKMSSSRTGKSNTTPTRSCKEEPLALTPMVFVMWEERYQAFLQKYKTLSFDTIAQAEQEKSGWESIAAKPEWGFFKFGHTNPNESNSGLMTLVLAAYGYSHKTRGLELEGHRERRLPGLAPEAGARRQRHVQQHRQHDAGDGSERSVFLRRPVRLRERHHRLSEKRRRAAGARCASSTRSTTPGTRTPTTSSMPPGAPRNSAGPPRRS